MADRWRSTFTPFKKGDRVWFVGFHRVKAQLFAVQMTVLLISSLGTEEGSVSERDVAVTTDIVSTRFYKYEQRLILGYAQGVGPITCWIS